MNHENYIELIRAALKEDLGEAGDVTSTAVFSQDHRDEFILFSKDTGILCGMEVFKAVFSELDKTVAVESYLSDGAVLKPHDPIALVRGPTRGIMSAERTAINFLSLLSGVATKTAAFVETAAAAALEKGKDVKPIIVLDTRKTIPGLRLLQKYAVSIGGGQNHRIGLFDMVMLKDNHIDAAGGITQAVEAVRIRWGKKYKIEVETRTLEEVQEALDARVDRIMLDNMDEATLRGAAEIIGTSCEIEASGNMSRADLERLADSGVTHISFGELTHTVRAFDFSLRRKPRE